MTPRKKQQQKPPTAVLLVFAALGIWFVFSQPPAPQPPLPDRPSGPDLYTVFSSVGNTTQAHADAVAFGVLCESLAAMIEYDGTRGEEARLTTGIQLDDLRRWSREYYMRGDSFGVRYPQLPEVVGGFLEAQIGESSGGLVDDTMRARWVNAHRALAQQSLWAANRLAGR